MQSANGCSIHLHGSPQDQDVMAAHVMSWAILLLAMSRKAPMPACLACLNMKCGVAVPCGKSSRSKAMRTHSQVHLII